MSIENKFAWSFSGFVIGVVSLILALLLFYSGRRQEKVNFKLIVESEENLVEIKEKIPDLKLLYKNQDITLNGKNIKIIKFSLKNQGKSILQDYYDKNKEFSVSFDSSIVLNTIIIESNSEYLSKDLLQQNIVSEFSNKSLIEKNKIIFNPIIFERDKYVIFKTYLLQSENIKTTNIIFNGKIADLDKLPIVHKIAENTTDNKYTTYIINIALIVYLALIISLLLMIFVLVGYEKYKNKKEIRKFLIRYPETIITQKALLVKLLKNKQYVEFANQIINNGCVFDITELANEYIKINFSTKSKLFSRKKDLQFSLPSEFFFVENGFVYLNKENEELIKKYVNK